MGGVRGVGAGSGGGAITLGLLAQHSSSQWSPASLPRALGEEAVSPDLRTKRNDKFIFLGQVPNLTTILSSDYPLTKIVMVSSSLTYAEAALGLGPPEAVHARLKEGLSRDDKKVRLVSRCRDAAHIVRIASSQHDVVLSWHYHLQNFLPR